MWLRVVIAGLVAAALVGCAPELRDDQFTCASGGCPDGFMCCEGTCRRACEVDGGGVRDGGMRDGGALDGGALDGGAFDGGALDGGAFDGGAFDAGRDAGALDGGPRDGGGVDAAPGAVGHCGACASDDQCVVGSACVPVTYGGTPLGLRCLPLAVSDACPGPVYTVLGSRGSAGGMIMICAPNESYVHCDAVLAFGAPCAECAALLPGASAICDGTRCTYECILGSDCPGGVCTSTCALP